MKRRYKGFTLIELLVTVAIIVILATLIIVNIAQVRMSGRDAKRVADVASIKLALELYKDKYGNYPPTSLGSSTDYGTWATASGSTIGGGIPQGNWDVLSNDLKSQLSPLPKDPLNKPGYRYYIYIYNDDKGTPGTQDDVLGTGAIIKTQFESGNNFDKMSNDSCSNNPNFYDIIVGYAPVDIRSRTCGDFVSTNYL